MSVFVVASDGSGTQTTFKKLAARVARIVGAQDEPEAVGAYDYIYEVMQQLNAEPWEYLGVRGDDIEIFDHRTRVLGQEGFQGQYTLPTTVRDIVSAKLKTLSTDIGGQPLVGINRGLWDRMVKDESAHGTRWLTYFNVGQEGKIELLDWPTGPGFLEIRYWRFMRLPESPDEILDLPAGGVLERYVALMARAEIAVDKGDLRKARARREEAERVMGKAKYQDRIRYLEQYTVDPPNVTDPFQVNVKRDPAWGYLRES